MAGLNKEELHIEIDRKKIKIAGVRKAIQLLKNARYCQAEIPHGYFERNVAPACTGGCSNQQSLLMPMEF